MTTTTGSSFRRRCRAAIPNPAHLSDAEYRQRATAAALEAAAANDAAQVTASVTFPGVTFAPTRVRVELSATPTLTAKSRDPRCA